MQPTYRIDVRHENDGLPAPWHAVVLLKRHLWPEVVVFVSEDYDTPILPLLDAESWLADLPMREEAKRAHRRGGRVAVAKALKQVAVGA